MVSTGGGAAQAASFQEVLKQTAGIWQAGDGLEYQERIRKEWP